mgnify:CR=1 FL=1
MAIEKRPIDQIMTEMRAYYDSGITQDVDWRIEQLKKLRKSMKKHQLELLDSMWKDYHKNAFDTWGYELAGTFAEIDDTIKHLKKWAAPKKSDSALFNMPSYTVNYRDPYGVTLVTNAWNFPIFCGVSPLIGAIAGGNCCVFKPASATSISILILADLVKDAIFQTGKAQHVDVHDRMPRMHPHDIALHLHRELIRHDDKEHRLRRREALPDHLLKEQRALPCPGGAEAESKPVAHATPDCRRSARMRISDGRV